MSDISRQDIEKLKEKWLHDPSWDIAETIGFEAHREELAAFHEEQRAIWIAEVEKEVEKRKEDVRTKAALKKCPLISQSCISDSCAWFLVREIECAIAELPNAVNSIARVISENQPPASYYR